MVQVVKPVVKPGPGKVRLTIDANGIGRFYLNDDDISHAVTAVRFSIDATGRVAFCSFDIIASEVEIDAEAAEVALNPVI